MFFPRLSPPRLTETTVSTFGGIDRSPVCSENFFSDTKNTSSEKYPLLSVREKRAEFSSLPDLPNALYTTNGFTLIVNDSLYYNGVLQTDSLPCKGKRQLVSMGGKIFVFPDNYYFNTLSTDESGNCTEKGYLSNKTTYTSEVLYLIPCLLDSPIPICSEMQPNNPTDGMLWLDTYNAPNKLYIYSAITQSWTNISPSFVCIEGYNIDKGFSVGDAIKLSGFGDILDGDNIISGIEDNRIIVSGNSDYYMIFNPDENSPISIERTIPIMDYVCEHQNRLFGCRYGTNNKGEFVNEIYASKLGDPKNWNVFQGLSTDSYAASCGTEGEWTGMISHMGNVVLFKENCIHRLFGTKPSNFTLYTDNYPGIKKKSEASLCLHNGTLYYHSENGIFSYSGSAPSCISQRLGKDVFSNAVSAVAKNVYHVCMTDTSGKRKLYTYDILKNIWHIQDDTDYKLLESYDDNVIGAKQTQSAYGVDILYSADIPKKLSEIFGTDKNTEPDLDWYAESGIIGLSSNEGKYLNKLKLRFKTSPGASLRVQLDADSSNVWRDVGHISKAKLGTYVLHILPPRCDHFKLRISGKGYCELYSMTKYIEISTEV